MYTRTLLLMAAKPAYVMVAAKLGILVAFLAGIDLTIGVPVKDPWFDLFTAWYVFSSVTAGMPEPDDKSTFGYIWLYRTCHILSANGTAYFSHRNMWTDISGMRDEKRLQPGQHTL